MPTSTIPAANVSMVPQRSPLRYPGGKTWLIPHVRHWLDRIQPRPQVLLEPFAGGASVSLTAVMENLVGRAVLVEMDPDVAAFWKVAVSEGEALAKRMLGYVPSRDSVKRLLVQQPESPRERAWRVLVLNRMLHNGILSPGSSVAKRGEAQMGELSRWYPETISRRMQAVESHSDRLMVIEADGLAVMEDMIGNDSGERVVVFADPPYVSPDKRRALRLYTHNDISHERMFDLLAGSEVDFLMTYNLTEDTIRLTDDRGFYAVAVAMKTARHTIQYELVITRKSAFPTFGTTHSTHLPHHERWATPALPIFSEPG